MTDKKNENWISDFKKNLTEPDIHFAVKAVKEARRAKTLFPAPNPNMAALTEEVGELSKALLQIGCEGKSDWSTVYNEAMQVAAMAVRIATEGDPTLGATPKAKDVS